MARTPDPNEADELATYLTAKLADAARLHRRRPVVALNRPCRAHPDRPHA